MKKLLSLFLALVLTASVPLSQGFIAEGAAIGEEPQESKDPRGSLMAGEMIDCSAAEPSNAAVTMNNKGMSGLGSYIHLHGTDQADSYESAYSGKKGAVVFSFSQIEALGYMYVWNYNAYGKLENGMKQVDVQYSTDKKNWFDLKDGGFELARALESENDQYGGNAANNLNDGFRTPIDFGGIPAKYVRIIPRSNYSGNAYGLSEVRFFRFKTRPDKGSLVSATARAPKASSNPVNIANSYGLSDLTSASALHTDKGEAMWLSKKSAADSFVVIDLDGTYPVDKINLWNYNLSGETGSGMKRVKIEYTARRPYDTSDSGINYAGGEWTTLGEYELAEGIGGPDMPFSLSVDFKNIQAQHIRITPLDNYGGEGYGLSAVRVFAGSGWAVEPSRDWSGMFSSEGTFDYQTSGVNKQENTGWLAADGVYSINMNGADRSGSFDSSAKTVFMFSDTLTGNFNNFAGKQNQYGKNMYYQGLKNNTFATLLGNKPDPRNFQYYLTASDNYQSILGDGNWAQELVKIGDKMYAWSFTPDANWTATKFMFNTFGLSASGLPDFTSRPKADDADFISEFTENGMKYRIEFSGAVMDNTAESGATPSPDGYIYLYGLKSHNNGFLLLKSPVVARVKAEDFKDVSSWRYYDGTDWVEDIQKCAVIDGGDGMVSNEFSVSYMESGTFAGKYVMAFTNFTQSSMLAIATSDTPFGPFNQTTNKIALYDCPDALSIREQNGDAGIYTYNAKAHPNLSAAGELLISYNLNSRNFDARSSFEFLHPEFVTLFDVDESTQSNQRTVSEDNNNLAPGADAIASHIESGKSAANTIDGDITTFWSSGETVNRRDYTLGPVSLTLKFEKEITADKLVINWGDGQARKSSQGYKVEYSADGVNWAELPAAYQYGSRKKYSGLTCSFDTLKFEKTKLKQIRVTISKAANFNTPEIRELELYNTSEKSAPPPEMFTPKPNAVGAAGEIDIDYSALQKQVDAVNAAGISKSRYTPASFAALSTALSRAKAMILAESAQTQAQADEMTRQLLSAFLGLVKAAVPKPVPVVKNGWVKKGSKTYYYKNNVLLKNAWIKLKGKTYRTDKKGAKLTGTRWVTVKGKKYRLSKSVLVRSKLISVGKSKYYAVKSGAIKKNAWIKLRKKWYRAGKDGRLLKNRVKKIGGKRYKFNKNCVCTNKGKSKR